MWKTLRTRKDTNRKADTTITVACEGNDAEAAALAVAKALQMENRHRRHCGDLPLAYEIQVKSGMTSMSP